MMRPSTVRLTSLLLCALVAAPIGCATSDGGVGGTGIATIRGNVLDPELNDGSLQKVIGAGASAAGIIVRVRDTAVSDETDEFGEFELTGEIAGEITIDFVRENHPVAAAERLIVPVDADITLKDVTLVDSVAAPEVIEVDNVLATTIGAPTCQPDGSGAFMARDDGGLTFAVSITSTTVITDTRGDLTCANITPESEVKFRGIQSDGDIVASDVRVLKLGRPLSEP